MNERIYVAIDVETTGLQPGVDEIIEVAAVKFRGGEILERYSQLVCPLQPLPLKITRLTGITAEDVATAPRFSAVDAGVARFIQSYPLVGHSIGFDLGMLQAQGVSFSQPFYDTFDLATLLMPQIPVYKLGAIADHLGIPHPADHRALNDAEVTAQVFAHLLGLIRQIDLGELNEICQLTARVPFPMRDLFEEALRGRAKNVFVAASRSVDSDLDVDSAPNVEVWPLDTNSDKYPSLYPTGDTRPLNIDAVAQFFAADGALGLAFPGYELRQPQVEMARSVAEAFNQSNSLIVEAGTGTGKGLAYLVPATMFAVQRGERVVISTNTINLQDQLFFKDIPDLQAIMAASIRRSFSAGGGPMIGMQPFTAALLKGRGNYLCLKRYHDLRRSAPLSSEEVRALLKVQLWLPSTTSGDKSELLLLDREAAAWGRINVTPETCIGPRCTFFHQCYFYLARRKAEAAHIVVVNHALLIADLSSQSSVLPSYSHVIIDEAHNLEDVATDQLGFTTDHATLVKFLDDLYLEGGTQAVSGLLSELPAHMGKGSSCQAEREKIAHIAGQLRPSLVRVRVILQENFAMLASFLTKAVQANQYDTRLRLTPDVRKKPAWIAIQEAWQNLIDSLAVIGDGLAKIVALLRDIPNAGIPGYDDLLMQISFLDRFALEARVQTGHIIFGHEESICWISQERMRETLTLTAVPLSVAATLYTQLFAQKETNILTSATLTITGSFGFVCDRLGLAEPEELMLESPFNYEEQALVFIPSDIPEPNQHGYQHTVEQILVELCGATGGRTMALFTANSALKQTYAAIQEPLEAQGIAVLGQNIDGSRRSVLERFKEFPRTVLLGTSSFWEGVDVVGDALSVLVIAKLPFAVPTDPIYAARSEGFADPFGEYSVPITILKFKQGFGRLIRSREDRGIVVILDKRLISKRYGQQFLDSLPHTRVRTGPLKQLPALATRFLT
ncbi:MAG: helicase C-terminal domain-containing protein [Chloroflexales bacterium]